MATREKVTEFGKQIDKMRQAFHKQHYVKVGVTGKHAGEQHKGEKGEEPATVAGIAAANEYGTKRIPARPFMRLTIERQRQAWEEQTKKEFIRIMDGKQDTTKALARIGAKMVGDLQATIRSNVPPANAASTVLTKTSSLKGAKRDKAVMLGLFGQGTLRDTGQMLNAMTYEVVHESRD